MSNWKQTFAMFFIGVLLVVVGFIAGTTIIPSLADSQPKHIAEYTIPEAKPVTLPVAQENIPVAAIESGYDFLSDAQLVMQDVYNRVSPSVVSIENAIQTRSGGYLNQSSGSGFVIDSWGHIITNFHVVDGADRLVVNFYDGTIIEAQVIGTDPAADIAVIRVELSAERLVPVGFANSDNLEVGQIALALGNPFSNEWTLTRGIISALHRTITGLDRNRYAIGGVIQTDAAINPGNSGGPLLNLRGEVIGVNAQIVSETRSNSGVGFAIPSNLVKRVATDLIREGQVNYSFMGITGEAMNYDAIQENNFPNNLRGTIVTSVSPSGPADRAGLQTSDVILQIDGSPVVNFDELIGYLAINTRPDQIVNLTVYRNGQYLTVPLTLGIRP